MNDGVVFDFDGVIADSMPLQEQCWRASVREVASEVGDRLELQITENLYKGFAGDQMFLSTDLSVEQKKRLRVTKDLKWNAIRNATPLMVDARKTLKVLTERYSLFIATTANRSYVEAVLNRDELLGLFEIILTNADVPNPKPHPDMLNKILAESRIARDHLLMVGDSESDLKMADNANVAFVPFGVDWSQIIYSEKSGARTWRELGCRLGVDLDERHD